MNHARSDEAREYRHLYDTAAWKHLREWKRRTTPYCEPCRKRGIVAAMAIVNHRIPHKGDPALFFDARNLESMCKPCHDGPTQHQERTGHERGCDAEGNPIDRASHWHRAPTVDGCGR